ncbi:hypothetical protein GCM10020331_011420 [Ectobacillus funiculus]
MQGVGLITIENGLFLVAGSISYGMPLMVEIGIFFDLMVTVIVIGILSFRIHSTFDSLNTEKDAEFEGMTEMGWIWMLLVIPVATGLIAWRIKKIQTYVKKFQVAGAFLMLLVGITLAVHVLTGSPITGANGLVYVDALGAFNLSLIVLVGFTSSVYSVGYMRHELRKDAITGRHFRQYYLWFHLFLATMLAVSVVNNLGLLWVGIELTTLVSALLVAFYRKRNGS